VFSFATDSATRSKTSSTIAEIRDHIVAQFPCYEVTRYDPTWLKLRCAGSDRFEDTQEMQFGVAPNTGRVYGLLMGQVPSNRERYEELTSALESVMRNK